MIWITFTLLASYLFDLSTLQIELGKRKENERDENLFENHLYFGCEDPKVKKRSK